MKRNPQKASFWHRHAREILLLLLVALGVHDIFGDHGFLAMRRTQKQIAQLSEEIKRLNQENDDLAANVNTLKTDPKAIERIAREEMGLARPGEMIFKLPAPPESSGTTPDAH
jgi:cell division protein FtsB